MSLTNPVLETIFERFSARGYKDQKLTDEQIELLGRAGAAAPSARNVQPWHIVLVKDQKLLTEIEDACYRNLTVNPDTKKLIDSRGGKVLYNPPLLVIIASQTQEGRYALMDTGIATENIVLAAKSLGLDSVIVGMAGAAFDGDGGKELEKRLGFPEGYGFGIGICIGYATEAGTKAPHDIDPAKYTVI